MSTLGARGLFTVAFLLLTGWGTFVVCAWDITLWSLIHLFINGVYFSFLLWKVSRAVKILSVVVPFYSTM